MSRPSEPLLRMIREVLRARGENTAGLAKQLGKTRADVRKLLSGEEPLTVDDLFRVSELLQLSPEDLGLSPVSLPEGVPVLAEATEAPTDEGEWKVQAEVLLRTGFDHGIDMLLLLDTAALAEWGGPDSVISSYKGKELPVGLDAAYHRYMEPRFDADGVTLKLSFDTLYDCSLPWASIQRVIFNPLPPPERKEPAPKKTGAPFLRLVE